MARFQHLTKISISLTNSQRVVLEDKRDLDLSYRRQKSQQELQQTARKATEELPQNDDKGKGKETVKKEKVEDNDDEIAQDFD